VQDSSRQQPWATARQQLQPQVQQTMRRLSGVLVQMPSRVLTVVSAAGSQLLPQQMSQQLL
jgi:hypothetical protein